MVFSPHATNSRTKDYCHQVITVAKIPKQHFPTAVLWNPRKQITQNYFSFLLHSSNLNFPVASFQLDIQLTSLSEMFSIRCCLPN